MVLFNTTFSKQYFPRLPGGVGDCPGAPDLSKPQKYYKREKKGGKKAPKYIVLPLATRKILEALYFHFSFTLIGGFKVSDAIGSGGANTLGRARGQRHFPYYFLLGVGILRLHNLLNFCKSIKESFNFTTCDQFLGIF
jgi:hypothetical protein